MATSDFVHLHVHSDYSLLDATCSVEGLLKRVKELGMPAVALTDHGNLFGALSFYDQAHQLGIKPIVGCELYVSAGAMDDPEARLLGRRDFHLTVLAMNEQGYRNLLQLVTAAHLKGFHHDHPRVDRAHLLKHAAGLVALSGCLSGEIPHALRHGDVKAAHEAALWHRDCFQGRFWLEVMDQGTDVQREVIPRLVALSKASGIPLVATNNVHYLAREDAAAHDVFVCIGTGRLRSEVDRPRYPSDQFHLRSAAEMAEVFRELPQALTATREVADLCHLELPQGQWHLPDFRTGSPLSNAQYLRELCLKGLEERCGKPTQVLLERLDRELSVIEKMGFTNYFLIVSDFIRFARQSGIPVGPGRGSAASSLASYSLKITSVDPMRYELLFERFLEPSRVTQPDIDIDFCQRRREEVLEYVRRKYGPQNVAQIITFGTLAAKAAIRDVGRVLDIPLLDIDGLAKRIPVGPDQTLTKALQADPELRTAFEQDERFRDLLDLSLKVEGLCRNASTHAAGVVIADRELSSYVPLYRGDRGVLTQYPMEAMERIGLLKMDFLGLETLTLLARCVELVRSRTGTLVDLENLPLDDPKAYAVLARGETQGVFQCESAGMRELMVRLKPGRIDDVIAAIALFRPGPLQSGMVETFIERKHGRGKVDYYHPLVEPVLKPTYGVIVYQEQVMQIANRLAGFSMAEADTLRKAMGKKNQDLLASTKEKFMAGCVHTRIPAALAEKVFKDIEYFAGYGFNKAHSTAYAIICYQTAWLKAHHPTEFMAAALTSVMEKTEKVASYLDECRRMGMEILPPSVNESELTFAVAAEGKIRFGLGAVRKVGDKAVQSVLDARQASGPFRSLGDLCGRTDLRLVNAGVLEQLVKAGAFDGLGGRRSQLVATLDEAIRLAQSAQEDKRRGQGNLFASSSAEGESLPEIPEWPEGQRLAHEKEALGFYVSSHPLARHERPLRRFSTAMTSALGNMEENREVILGGVISKFKRTTAKKGKSEGDRMAILTIEDLEGACEAVVFPGTYAETAQHLGADRVVFLQGKLDRRREEPSLKVNAVVPMDKAFETFTNAVTVRPPMGADEAWLLDFRRILREHPGECPVYLEFDGRSATERTVMVGNDLFVTPSRPLVEALEALAGETRVVLGVRRRIAEPTRGSAPRASTNSIPF